MAASARRMLAAARCFSSSSSGGGAKKAWYNGTKIVCVAKNYADHVKEMGGKPKPAAAPPVFFLKPSSSVVHPPGAIVIPAGVKNVHHEVELGVVIGKRGRRIAAADWRTYVRGYVVALDMTARDIQAAAKAAGEPWAVAKGYDTFCAMSEEVPAEHVEDPHDLHLSLTNMNTLVQAGVTGDMIHRIPQLLAAASAVMTLEPGDVLLTGTPSGVAAVAPGDILHAAVVGVVSATFPVVAEPPLA